MRIPCSRALDHETAETYALPNAAKRTANQDGNVVLSDLYRQALGPRANVHACPGRGLGAFVFDIDSAQFLYPYIQFWPAESRTARTILVRVVNGGLEIRSAPGEGTAISLRVPLGGRVKPLG
jgi:hypothetical protein